MYVSDDVRPTLEKLERENGSWGVMSVILRKETQSLKQQHDVFRIESGSFPLKEEVHMVSEMGSVGTSRGVTITTGEYQTARVDVWISLPCKVEDADVTFNKCAEWVNERVQKEVAEIQQFIRKNETKPTQGDVANG
jgi:hypothetical protein